MLTTVVHCKVHPCSLYIGRPSEFGNPFVIGKDGDRSEVIEKYKRWLIDQPSLIDKLDTLKGQILGCWCAPEPCHGDILAYLANSFKTYGKLYICPDCKQLTNGREAHSESLYNDDNMCYSVRGRRGWRQLGVYDG